jgi:hypothetical protein
MQRNSLLFRRLQLELEEYVERGVNMDAVKRGGYQRCSGIVTLSLLLAARVHRCGMHF